jgi:hypothetical protein
MDEASQVTVPVKRMVMPPSVWIREQEDDETLIKNIGKERRRAESKGMVLPDHGSISKISRIPQLSIEHSFCITDRLDNSLGFAVCLRKQKILDQNTPSSP